MNNHAAWISDWNPEDEKYWATKGKKIARSNLIWSIIAEHLGFSIWLIWSIVATKLPQGGFHYSTQQLFQLVALPGLIGSLMRFPYTFAVPRFGGRNWTIISAALLFVPTISLAYFVGRPETPDTYRMSEKPAGGSTSEPDVNPVLFAGANTVCSSGS